MCIKFVTMLFLFYYFCFTAYQYTGCALNKNLSNNYNNNKKEVATWFLSSCQVKVAYWLLLVNLGVFFEYLPYIYHG